MSELQSKTQEQPEPTGSHFKSRLTVTKFHFSRTPGSGLLCPKSHGYYQCNQEKLSYHKSYQDYWHFVLHERPWREARPKERQVCIILSPETSQDRRALMTHCLTSSLQIPEIFCSVLNSSHAEKSGFLVTVTLTILI